MFVFRLGVCVYCVTIYETNTNRVNIYIPRPMVSEEARLTGVLGPGEFLMDINACAACACAVGNAFASVDASGGIGSE